MIPSLSMCVTTGLGHVRTRHIHIEAGQCYPQKLQIIGVIREHRWMGNLLNKCTQRKGEVEVT